MWRLTKNQTLGQWFIAVRPWIFWLHNAHARKFLVIDIWQLGMRNVIFFPVLLSSVYHQLSKTLDASLIVPLLLPLRLRREIWKFGLKGQTKLTVWKTIRFFLLTVSVSVSLSLSLSLSHVFLLSVSLSLTLSLSIWSQSLSLFL